MSTKLHISLNVLLIAILVLATNCKKSSTEPKNNLPVISSVTVSPSSVPASGLAAVAVTATDADNDNLTYIFTPDDGTISSGSEAIKLWTAPNTPGSYSIAIAVLDGEGGKVTDTGNLTVTEAVTQITGIAELKDGTTGNFNNAMVSIYASWWDFVGTVPSKSIPISVAGSLTYFTFIDIEPGKYYLDVWSDNDNSGHWSTGDYIGVHGDGEIGNYQPKSFDVFADATIMLNITVDVATGDLY